MHTCVCVYVCIDVWMYGCMYGCMCVCMDGWMDVCMDVLMYGCMCVWMYVYVCMCVYVLINILNTVRAEPARGVVYPTQGHLTYRLIVACSLPGYMDLHTLLESW